MKMKLYAIAAAAFLLASATADAQQGRSRDFTLASLEGRYAAQEAGDGVVAVGLGVVDYDGHGSAIRKITVNAPDGEGGRQLLVFESTGVYTVNPDGTGTVIFTNTAPNPGAIDTFDFVITGSVPVWRPGRHRSLVATELFAAQREAGVTVSLVTSVQKRIAEVPR